MKTSRRTKFRIAALVVAITAFLASPELPPVKFIERSQRARLATGKMITLKFTPAGERPLRVSQLEVGLIKIEREGESTYTFSPTVADWPGGTVTIKVFSPEVAGSPGGSRTLVVEKTGDTYFTAYYADSGSSFKIEVIGVKTGSWPVGGPLTALNDAGGDRRVCGYAISTVCGGCYDQRRGELF